MRNTLIFRAIEQSVGDWRYPFILFSWWLAKILVPRRKVKINGIEFTLTCTNWITHFRWYLFKTKEPDTINFIDKLFNLESKVVVIFGGGTGNPYFTTDTAATLRAIEIEADVILKGTRVDGIFTADPEKDSTATMYETISFDEVFQKKLRVMDLTAFTLCKENKLLIKVFNMNTEGNLQKICNGENVGTLVKF